MEVATAAGQLGIKGSANITKFTETFSKLEIASDVAGQEGAKAIARILNVTGEGVGTIDKFASSLVDLGNNSAAGEAEILNMATRIGTSTARFNLGSANVLGISTAMKSMGLQAESSGSVVGRSFNAISKAIQRGGLPLKQLQAITQKSGEELRVQFKENSTKVFADFIKGLARLEGKGKDFSRAMENMGLSGSSG